MAVVAPFRETLAVGQLGESLIARWLRARGWHVLPAYEKEIDNGKGPRLFLANGSPAAELITPDLLTLRGASFKWVEAKHKTTFTWYGKGRCWETGIDLRHWHDYQQVQAITGIPVYLFFLHRDSHTRPEDVARWGAPPECPTGLFAGGVEKLSEANSHESPKWGPTGMIYWQPFTHLRKIAELADVLWQPANGSLFLR